MQLSAASSGDECRKIDLVPDKVIKAGRVEHAACSWPQPAHPSVSDLTHVPACVRDATSPTALTSDFFSPTARSLHDEQKPLLPLLLAQIIGSDGMTTALVDWPARIRPPGRHARCWRAVGHWAGVGPPMAGPSHCGARVAGHTRGSGTAAAPVPMWWVLRSQMRGGGLLYGREVPLPRGSQRAHMFRTISSVTQVGSRACGAMWRRASRSSERGDRIVSLGSGSGRGSHRSVAWCGMRGHTRAPDGDMARGGGLRSVRGSRPVDNVDFSRVDVVWGVICCLWDLGIRSRP